MSRTRSPFLALGCALALGLAGCGESAEKKDDNINRQKVAKVEAMKQLAEAVEKNDKPGIAAAVEGLVSNALDAKADPEAAKEFVEIYNKRVKDKLKGDEATQVKGIALAVEADLKK